MAGIIFNQIQQWLLSVNENMVKVTSKSIAYADADAFRLKAIKKYSLRKWPARIFRKETGYPRIENSISWNGEWFFLKARKFRKEECCKITKTKSYKNSYVVNREKNTEPNLLNTIFR